MTKMMSFWDGLPVAVRTSLIAILGSLATITGFKAQEMISPKQSPDALYLKIDRRLGRIEAGWDAFVDKRPVGERVYILEAMANYQKRRDNREGN